MYFVGVYPIGRTKKYPNRVTFRLLACAGGEGDPIGNFE